MGSVTYKVEKPLTIQEKIDHAHKLHKSWGKRLGSEPKIAELCAAIEKRSTETRQVMNDLGVVAICRDCEENHGGSCCGAGIENKYNDVLLLVNLLLGATLPQSRQKERSCYFLGDQGCLLKARHALCINYLCFRVEKKLSRDDLIHLQHVGGDEIEALFILFEEIKKMLRHYTHV